MTKDSTEVEEFCENDIISASPTSSPVKPLPATERPTSKLLEDPAPRTPDRAESMDEDLDVIPSSQNEEMETTTTSRGADPVDTTLVARVECSQPFGGDLTPHALGPLPICDTMPFTQAAPAPRVPQTSIIADTENMFGRNEEESSQPTIYITGSNLTSEQAVSLSYIGIEN